MSGCKLDLDMKKKYEINDFGFAIPINYFKLKDMKIVYVLFSDLLNTLKQKKNHYKKSENPVFVKKLF